MAALVQELLRSLRWLSLIATENRDIVELEAIFGHALLDLLEELGDSVVEAALVVDVHRHLLLLRLAGQFSEMKRVQTARLLHHHSFISSIQDLVSMGKQHVVRQSHEAHLVPLIHNVSMLRFFGIEVLAIWIVNHIKRSHLSSKALKVLDMNLAGLTSTSNDDDFSHLTRC